MSFRAGNLMTGSLIPEEISLEHWALVLGLQSSDTQDTQLVQVYPVLTWLWNSIRLAVLSGVSLLVLSATGAYALSRVSVLSNRQLLKIVLIIQLFPPVLSLTAYYVMFEEAGKFASWSGFNSVLSLVLIYTGNVVVFLLLMKGYFDRLDSSLDDAARIDGANHWQIFRFIILPASKPMSGVVFLLAFIAAISEYPVASILLNKEEDMTLAVGMRLFLQVNDYRWGDFAAASLLTGIPVALVFLWVQRWLNHSSES